MIYKKIVLLILFILIGKFSFSLSIYPKSFEEDITQGAVEVYTIINDTKEKKLYKIDASMEEEGIEKKIFPRIFFLEPNEKKEVKVFLKPNSSLKNNIYRGNLIVQIVSTKIKNAQNLKLNVYLDINAIINKNNIINLI